MINLLHKENSVAVAVFYLLTHYEHCTGTACSQISLINMPSFRIIQEMVFSDGRTEVKERKCRSASAFCIFVIQLA